MVQLKQMTLPFAVLLTIATLTTVSLSAVIEQTTEELVEQSNAIIRAEVNTINSYWNDDKTFIFTAVTLRITEVLKELQAMPEHVTVVVPGGEIDGTGLGVEHAAKFQIGEDVLVFLAEIEKDVLGVTAWEQGKFTIVEGNVQEKEVTLDDFLIEIKRAIKQ